MKLIKALESGRPFRLKGGTSWFTAFSGVVTGEGGASRGIALEQLSSDEWETQEKAVAVSKSELRDKIARIMPPSNDVDQLCNDLAKELGL